MAEETPSQDTQKSEVSPKPPPAGGATPSSPSTPSFANPVAATPPTAVPKEATSGTPPSSQSSNDLPITVEGEEVIGEGPLAKSKRKVLVFGAITILILILAGGAFLFFGAKGQKPKEENAPASQERETKSTPPTSSSPSSSAKPKKTSFDRSEMTLEVLNGSGASGQAAKVADKLAALGYTIIKVGNADRQTYKESQLLLSSKLKDKASIEGFMLDLKKELDIATSSGVLKDSSASAQIIIGKASVSQ